MEFDRKVKKMKEKCGKGAEELKVIIGMGDMNQFNILEMG